MKRYTALYVAYVLPCAGDQSEVDARQETRLVQSAHKSNPCFAIGAPTTVPLLLITACRYQISGLRLCSRNESLRVDFRRSWRKVCTELDIRKLAPCVACSALRDGRAQLDDLDCPQCDGDTRLRLVHGPLFPPKRGLRNLHSDMTRCEHVGRISGQAFSQSD